MYGTIMWGTSPTYGTANTAWSAVGDGAFLTVSCGNDLMISTRCANAVVKESSCAHSPRLYGRLDCATTSEEKKLDAGMRGH